MIQTLRSAVAEVDPLLALQHVESMNGVISDIEAPRRFNTGLITGFAVGALLLAMTGIYAVVAFSVSLRTQEIAIRMALGAQRGGIARLVLFRALDGSAGVRAGRCRVAGTVAICQFLPLRRERDRSNDLHRGCRDHDADGIAGVGAARRARSFG